MIFVQAAKEPTMILMLAEKDVQSMRQGRTLFVDERQTCGTRFNKVVLSLAKTDQESLALIRQAGYDTSKLGPQAEPTLGEARCNECQGCIAAALMFEGKCTVCWATLAKKLMNQNG